MDASTDLPIPDELHSALDAVVRLTDVFCRARLNEEYVVLCKEVAAELCDDGPPLLLSGKPQSWACAIVHAVGWVNFLSDPMQPPHIRPGDLSQSFGVSVSNMQAKSRVIRDELGMDRLDPQWILPSLREDHPFGQMLTLAGAMMSLTEEVEEKADPVQGPKEANSPVLARIGPDRI